MAYMEIYSEKAQVGNFTPITANDIVPKLTGTYGYSSDNLHRQVIGTVELEAPENGNIELATNSSTTVSVIPDDNSTKNYVKIGEKWYEFSITGDQVTVGEGMAELPDASESGGSSSLNASSNNVEITESSMMYGALWDATMQWLAKSNISVGYRANQTTSGYGNYNTEDVTVSNNKETNRTKIKVKASGTATKLQTGQTSYTSKKIYMTYQKIVLIGHKKRTTPTVECLEEAIITAAMPITLIQPIVVAAIRLIATTTILLTLNFT